MPLIHTMYGDNLERRRMIPTSLRNPKTRRPCFWMRGSMMILACFSFISLLLVHQLIYGARFLNLNHTNQFERITIPTEHNNKDDNSNNNNNNTTRIFQPPLRPGQIGQKCHYEGHCGVGTTCVKVVADANTPRNYLGGGGRQRRRGGGGGGLCESYIENTTLMAKSSPCAQFCIHGLGIHDKDVDTVVSTVGRGRPDGCILYYNALEQFRYFFFERDVQLQHRIVRVDPVLEYYSKTSRWNNNNNKNNNNKVMEEQRWMAFCYEPCGSCGDGEAFTCEKGSCQRNEAVWQDGTQNEKTQDHHEMVIVSGANDRYFLALMNLAGSLRYWAPKHKMVVYNLGLSNENINRVQKWGNVLDIKWKDGFPKHYASHISIGGRYAWKPVAINESLHEYKQIFWLDAGSTIVSPIDEVIRITQQSGIFLVKGQDESMALSHELTYKAFGYDKRTFRGGPHYSGNTQAYLYPSRYVDTIVIPNAKCALSIDCIMPHDSKIQNHRYDQTTLSILSYRFDLRIPYYTVYLAASKDQIEHDWKKPSKQIVWTSRGTSSQFLKLMEGYDPRLLNFDLFSAF